MKKTATPPEREVTTFFNRVQPPSKPPFEIRVADRVKRLPPYLFAQINKLKYQKRRAGDDVIDLGMGNPSDPPQDLVIEKLAEAARGPEEPRLQRVAGAC